MNLKYSSSMQGYFAPILLATLLLNFNGIAAAATWENTTGISLSTAVTGSEQDGEDSENEGVNTILSFSPYVNINGTGRKARVSTRLGLGVNHFANDGSTKFDPSATLGARATLIQRASWVDMKARVSQQFIDDSGLLTDSLQGVNQGKLRYEFNISPSFDAHLSEFVRLKASYGLAVVRSEDDNIVGGDLHSVNAEVQSAIGRTGHLAVFRASRQQIELQNNESGYTADALVGFVYRFSDRLAGQAGLGTDWVRLAEEDETISENVWLVGMRWTPSPFFVSQATYARRSFGIKPGLSVSLIGRRSSIDLNWSRDYAISEAVGAGTSSSSDAVQDVNSSDPTDALSSDLLPDDISLAPFGRDAESVVERVSLKYSVGGQVTDVFASVSWVDRTFPELQSSVTGRSFAVGAKRELSGNTTLSLLARTGRSESSSDDIKTNTYRFVATLIYKF